MLQSLIAACVFRFVNIVMIHTLFNASACERVLSTSLDCLTGMNFIHNVMLTVNFNFYLGVLLERIVVTWRTWRHPTQFAQQRETILLFVHNLVQTTILCMVLK